MAPLPTNPPAGQSVTPAANPPAGQSVTPAGQAQAIDMGKTLVVIGGLVGTLVLAGWIGVRVDGGFANYLGGKTLLVTGIGAAFLGQLAESVSKTSDFANRPRLLDGLGLYGEGIKFYGALAALLGAVFAIDL